MQQVAQADVVLSLTYEIYLACINFLEGCQQYLSCRQRMTRADPGGVLAQKLLRSSWQASANGMSKRISLEANSMSLWTRFAHAGELMSSLRKISAGHQHATAICILPIMMHACTLPACCAHMSIYASHLVHQTLCVRKQRCFPPKSKWTLHLFVQSF